MVLDMAIDADGEMVDGKPERLPKQISRHLLPVRKDRIARKLVHNKIRDFLEDLGESSSRPSEELVKSSATVNHTLPSQAIARYLLTRMPLILPAVRESPS